MGPTDGPFILPEITAAWEKIPKLILGKFTFSDDELNTLQESASRTYKERIGTTTSEKSLESLARDRVLATLASEANRLAEEKPGYQEVFRLIAAELQPKQPVWKEKR